MALAALAETAALAEKEALAQMEEPVTPSWWTRPWPSP
jgi:hypothetical protein